MSSQKTKDELKRHKNAAISAVSSYIDALIQSDDTDINGKADKLSYWLKDYVKFLQFEPQFNPSSQKKYKRGDIIQVHLGYNIGSEEGGLHYAAVIEKENSIHSPVITIVPLTSIKSNKDLDNLRKGEVNLGDELFRSINIKLKGLKSSMLDELNNIKNTIDHNPDNSSILINDLNNRLHTLKSELKLVEKIQDKIHKMKSGSIALTNQITTISKIRIYDPKKSHDVLSGIRLSPTSMDAIDAEIIKQYTK